MNVIEFFNDETGEKDIEVSWGSDGLLFSALDEHENYLLSTAEAKALLKFLKKHLEPKLENV